MLFDSYLYFIFLIVLLMIYRQLNHSRQNLLLLIASYIFYGAWSVKFLSLIFISTVTDYYIAQAMAQTDDQKRRRQLLWVSITTNLGLLGFFKYCNFFIESFIELAGFFGWHPAPLYLNIILPVGISFYTFQTLGYTIDVYRKDIKPCTKFLDFALFVSFFPQLVAGPIERAGKLLPQLQTKRSLKVDWFGAGWLILLGLVKKAVIANQLAVLADPVFTHPEAMGFWETVVGLYAFTFQIYCDFSGYTDIARGSAKLLGFELSLNFNQPYLATSPQDFWRRWHMSLSQWLRDYLYIPLGGGRYHPLRNVMVTMLLGGLWHGAAWHFVLWGAYHGALLALHRALKSRLQVLSQWCTPRVWTFLSIGVMFHITVLGWLIFRVDKVEDISTLLFNLTQVTPLLGPVAKQIVLMAFLTIPIWLNHYFKENLKPDYIVSASPWLRINALVYLILMLCFWAAHHDIPFIYFQF